MKEKDVRKVEQSSGIENELNRNRRQATAETSVEIVEK